MDASRDSYDDLRIIRLAELRELLGVSRATVHRMVRRGEIPPPLQLSKGCSGWRASTIRRHLEEREAAAQGAA